MAREASIFSGNGPTEAEQRRHMTAMTQQLLSYAMTCPEQINRDLFTSLLQSYDREQAAEAQPRAYIGNQLAASVGRYYVPKAPATRVASVSAWDSHSDATPSPTDTSFSWPSSSSSSSLEVTPTTTVYYPDGTLFTPALYQQWFGTHKYHPRQSEEKRTARQAFLEKEMMRPVAVNRAYPAQLPHWAELELLNIRVEALVPLGSMGEAPLALYQVWQVAELVLRAVQIRRHSSHGKFAVNKGFTAGMHFEADLAGDMVLFEMGLLPGKPFFRDVGYPFDQEMAEFVISLDNHEWIRVANGFADECRYFEGIPIWNLLFQMMAKHYARKYRRAGTMGQREDMLHEFCVAFSKHWEELAEEHAEHELLKRRGVPESITARWPSLPDFAHGGKCVRSMRRAGLEDWMSEYWGSDYPQIKLRGEKIHYKKERELRVEMLDTFRKWWFNSA